MDTELSSEAYANLIDHTVDILSVLDESGIIQYVSPSVKPVLGYECQDLMGQNAFDYIHSKDRQVAVETFSTVVGSDEEYTTGRFDYRFQHEDGSWVWLEGRGSNQVTSEIGGYVIAARDITDRKKSKQALQQERDRLERFSNIITHDLRNPLNVAMGRLELVREEVESDHMEAVARSLTRMDEMIDDVSALVYESEAEPLLDSVNLKKTVKRCWQNVETEEATLNIETDQSIVADERRLQHLIENFLRNGIEHGGKAVTITIGSLPDGFYVEDDGQGLPESDKDALLEYRYSTKANGTGLGLSIVHEVVKIHGWDITIKDGEHGGARFEITNIEVTN